MQGNLLHTGEGRAAETPRNRGDPERPNLPPNFGARVAGSHHGGFANRGDVRHEVRAEQLGNRPRGLVCFGRVVSPRRAFR